MFYRKIRGKGKRSVTNGDAAFFRTRKRAANTFTRIEKKESGIRAYTVRYILYSKYPDVRSNILPVKKKSRARERDFLIRGNKNTKMFYDAKAVSASWKGKEGIHVPVV